MECAVRAVLRERPDECLIATSLLADLSWRALEVLAMLVEGKEDTQIGQALSIRPQTVKHHVTSIVIKRDVPSRTLAAVQAESHRMV